MDLKLRLLQAQSLVAAALILSALVLRLVRSQGPGLTGRRWVMPSKTRCHFLHSNTFCHCHLGRWTSGLQWKRWRNTSCRSLHQFFSHTHSESAKRIFKSNFSTHSKMWCNQRKLYLFCWWGWGHRNCTATQISFRDVDIRVVPVGAAISKRNLVRALTVIQVWLWTCWSYGTTWNSET